MGDVRISPSSQTFFHDVCIDTVHISMSAKTKRHRADLLVNPTFLQHLERLRPLLDLTGETSDNDILNLQYNLGFYLKPDACTHRLKLSGCAVPNPIQCLVSTVTRDSLMEKISLEKGPQFLQTSRLPLPYKNCVE